MPVVTVAIPPSPASAPRPVPPPDPDHRSNLPEQRARLLAAGALAAVTAGLVLALTGHDAAARDVWAAGVLIVLVPLTWSVASSLRHGDVGVDVIALLAMAGALALGEELAGAVIALMLAGGNELEAAAGRRARRDLTALLDRAPRIAHRRRDEHIEEVGVAALAPGDRVIVRAGDIVPVDGVVEDAAAVVDESALTGEALPVTRRPGDPVRSGSVAAGEAFEVRVTRDAASSAYGQIVRMVEGARADRAPFVRMADRYAVGFLAITVVLAGGAWLASGDPVRALAVLVVATPCPLILAAPVAIVAGLSRASRTGVVIKAAARSSGWAAPARCCSTRPGRSPLGPRRCAASNARPASTQMRSCGWRHRPTSSPPTFSPRPSSTPPRDAGWRSRALPRSSSTLARDSRASWMGAESRSAARAGSPSAESSASKRSRSPCRPAEPGCSSESMGMPSLP